jgi:hypothetical protein
MQTGMNMIKSNNNQNGSQYLEFVVGLFANPFTRVNLGHCESEKRKRQKYMARTRTSNLKLIFFKSFLSQSGAGMLRGRNAMLNFYLEKIDSPCESSRRLIISFRHKFFSDIHIDKLHDPYLHKSKVEK